MYGHIVCCISEFITLSEISNRTKMKQSPLPLAAPMTFNHKSVAMTTFKRNTMMQREQRWRSYLWPHTNSRSCIVLRWRGRGCLLLLLLFPVGGYAVTIIITTPAKIGNNIFEQSETSLICTTGPSGTCRVNNCPGKRNMYQKIIGRWDSQVFDSLICSSLWSPGSMPIGRM